MKFLSRRLDMDSIGVEHPSLNQYVQQPTASGTLLAIYNASNKSTEKLTGTFSSVLAEERHALRRFLAQFNWKSVEENKELNVTILRALPIFELYGTNELVTLNDKALVPPLHVNPSLLNSNFVKVSHESDMSLLEYLGVTQISKVTLYTDYVFPQIPNFDAQLRNATMATIIREFPELVTESPSIAKSLETLPFVETESGNLFPPSSLFDPRVSLFNQIFDKTKAFPSGMYSSSGVLSVLVGLGLNQVLRPAGLIRCAEIIAETSRVNAEAAIEHSKNLIEYLNTEPPSVFDEIDESVAKQLSVIEWIPVIMKSSHPLLPWKPELRPVEDPINVRLPEDQWYDHPK